MNKKNVYLIIGGVVLAIILIVVLVVGFTGKGNNAPVNNTNPTIGDVLNENTVPDGTNTEDSDETIEDEMTLPDGFDEDEWYYDEEGNLVNRYPNEFDENGNIIVRIPEDVKVGDT